MRKILNIINGIIFILFITTTSYAQHRFEISGQFIPRLEQRHGYRTLAPLHSKSAVFVSERLRLNFDYQNKYVRLYASLQDVRTWGSEEQVKNFGSFGLHEGWAEIFIKNKASVKLGRQEIVYDDHRLFGNLDWVQAARSHDGIVVKYFNKNTIFHVGGAFNQSGENLLGTDYRLKNYKALVYGYFNQKFDSGRTSLSVYAITDGFQNKDTIKPATYFRFTGGPRFEAKYKHINANAAVYVQTGKTISNQIILAYFAGVYAEYTHPKINAGIGYDYLSGNNASKIGDTKYHAFNTLYATNHKFYGHMDYFLDLPADTKLGGLQDLYVRLNYRPKHKGMIGTDVHYFFSGNKIKDVKNPGNYLKLPLGFELDLYGTYKPYEFMEIRAGYSVMAATASMEAIKGGSKNAYNGWSFVMISLKPSLFKYEKEAKPENK